MIAEQDRPAVSVILPVFNGAATVTAAIQSIQAQTFTDWELVVLDDASTDESLEICRQTAADDDRIRVLERPVNRGLAAAMNRLVEEASADLIAVQEQDDRSMSGRLAAQVALLGASPDVGMVSGIARWVDGDREVALFPGVLARGESYPDDMVEYLLVEQCKVVNACVMFRRRCLPDRRQAFDEGARMSIDWQFFVEVAHHDRIVGLPEVLVEMDRSSNRGSVTADKRLQGTEARRFLRKARRRYLHDPASPVNRHMLRRAWATQINLEGRWRGGVMGFGKVLVALALDPGSETIRASVQDNRRRGRDRLQRMSMDAAKAVRTILPSMDRLPVPTPRQVRSLLRPHAIRQHLLSREIAGYRAKSGKGILLGSAGQRIEGLVSCDLFDEQAELRIDATELSVFEDNSVDYIEHHHMIEHLPIDNVAQAVGEWYRVLEPGGYLVFTCPDFDALARLWTRTRSEAGRAKVERMVYGPQNHEGQFHRSAHTGRSLRRLVQDAGFDVVRSYAPFPNRSTPSQLLVARKPEVP